MARSHASDPLGLPAVPADRLPAHGRVLPMAPAFDCVVALRALGEDTRLRIIGLLMERPMDVSEISARLGVSPYNVSKHLRVLREAGLLEVGKDGRQRRYALPDAIRSQAAEGRVLDLGCCSFRFDGGGLDGTRSVNRTRQAQPERRSSQQQNGRRK